MLALALELSHFPFVPDLLGLDISLVRFHLAQLFAEFKVAGFEISHTLQHLHFEIMFIGFDLSQLLAKLFRKGAVQPVKFFRSLRVGCLVEGITHCVYSNSYIGKLHIKCL